MNVNLPHRSGTRFVIYHQEAGIYLGNCLGMGFWSKWDPVGQPEAVTFESETEARQHIASWENELQDLEVKPVDTDGSRYATIAQIEAAGLPGWKP